MPDKAIFTSYIELLSHLYEIVHFWLLEDWDMKMCVTSYVLESCYSAGEISVNIVLFKCQVLLTKAAVLIKET